jgi:hypothetical protein
MYLDDTAWKNNSSGICNIQTSAEKLPQQKRVLQRLDVPWTVQSSKVEPRCKAQAYVEEYKKAIPVTGCGSL